ncbi:MULTISPECIES: cbb3-type cytochrome oxidase assembly protein CcoS [Pseudoalteromonas]|uniref:Cytochrome oxidase maturation protein, cbb3-type n=1 Tax=Pseudoalteromonas luteoviolacea (strain 2ta16) TaxID=1353533 RepID=V4H0N2_PSEL2|nr:MULTISPECIES: cbb3-type cytochrome oxidase assembly protein CcoS [Pseudoalteromonas]ESP90991.1 cytochrome oxidase maturation protein, cbb3-type [Pseudoalteromonas luteoviolacea 2ta16]KZN38251.1 cytochrome oxidase maturation protein Cbb3 [Pseudoalteromonas luteoviolacea NCIMB 1944]MCG7547684.1 cbb3-type cytochrome oxidase assembly protein CcoS [Pseudoalteromonas sp. Of7M-16]
MSIIYILIPIAILFVVIAIGVFFWAVRSEQFSDLNKQAHSILFEDDKEQHKKSNDGN